MQTAGSRPNSISTANFAMMPVTASSHPGNLGWMPRRGPILAAIAPQLLEACDYLHSRIDRATTIIEAEACPIFK